MAFQAPNYTQIPNALLGTAATPGLMAEMSGAELKVMLALCRQTIGWHKRSERVSVVTLCRMTGLSHGSVHIALSKLIKRGFITKQAQAGTTNRYALIFSSEQDDTTDDPPDPIEMHSDEAKNPSKPTDDDYVHAKNWTRGSPNPGRPASLVCGHIKETIKEKKQHDRDVSLVSASSLESKCHEETTATLNADALPVPGLPDNPGENTNTPKRKPRRAPERSQEEKELMGVFCEATGLRLPTRVKDVNWWFSELRVIPDLVDGDYERAKRLIRRTVKTMRDGKSPLTITTPKSIIGMANSLSAKSNDRVIVV